MRSLLTFALFYCIKQIDSMLLSVCSVIGHRIRQNVVRKVAHEPDGSCATFLFFLPLDVIFDLFNNGLLTQRP